MREIEFRGYNEYHDEWFFGSYVDGYIIDGVVEANEEYIVIENWVPVEKESIGRFTEIKDKNGVEIYEGDIISAGFIYDYQVIIEDGHVKGVYKSKATLDEQLLFQEDIDDSGYEIIGNIYENPELLNS
ncbi:MAG TPA: YopX family protein [Tissierellaceae bacterium]|nr:YopX family protein [Tissierellaceae bacterium]